MKNFLQAIILILVIISFSQLTAPKVFANINDDDADYLLSRSYRQWISRDNSQRFVIRSVYEQGINRGLTHQQALNEARAVFASVNNTLNSNSTANVNILSSIPGLSWHFTKEENGNLSVSANTTNNFQPSVPEGLRNRDAILIGLENDARSYGQYPDNDEDVHDGVNQIDNSQSKDNPTLTEQHVPNQTANSGTTASNGNVAGSGNANATADCGTEGLEGQRFLFFRGPLVPCGINKHCAGNNNISIDKPCTLCHFFVLIQNFFNFLLSLLIVVSIFMLTIAGVLYIVSAGGRMATVAKEIIQKTLLGFTLFLLSWLIIFTLLKLLAVNTSMLGTGGDTGWFQFTCDDESAFWVETDNVGGGSGGNNVNGGGGGNNTAGGNGGDNTAGGSEEHTQEPSPSVTATNANEREQAYRNMLRNAGIRINHNNHCTSPNESGCTTLVGAREYTLNKIMQLKADDCPSCDIQVNAVTDKWIDSNGVAHTNQEAHSTNSPYSHDNGYKVDYLATPSLNRHLTGVSNASQLSSIPDGQTNGVLTRAGSRGGEYSGPRFYDNEGNEWVYETSKGVWDVKYDQGASRHQ